MLKSQRLWTSDEIILLWDICFVTIRRKWRFFRRWIVQDIFRWQTLAVQGKGMSLKYRSRTIMCMRIFGNRGVRFLQPVYLPDSLIFCFYHLKLENINAEVEKFKFWAFYGNYEKHVNCLKHCMRIIKKNPPLHLKLLLLDQIFFYLCFASFVSLGIWLLVWLGSEVCAIESGRLSEYLKTTWSKSIRILNLC